MVPNTNRPPYSALNYPSIYQVLTSNSLNEQIPNTELKDKEEKETLSQRCNACARTFKTILGFKRHNCLEKGFKYFNCEMCEKSFRRKRALDEHQNIHDKKFECKVCGKCFSLGSYLRLHEDEHQRIQPFKC